MQLIRSELLTSGPPSAVSMSRENDCTTSRRGRCERCGRHDGEVEVGVYRAYTVLTNVVQIARPTGAESMILISFGDEDK